MKRILLDNRENGFKITSKFFLEWFRFHLPSIQVESTKKTPAFGTLDFDDRPLYTG